MARNVRTAIGQPYIKRCRPRPTVVILLSIPQLLAPGRIVRGVDKTLHIGSLEFCIYVRSLTAHGLVIPRLASLPNELPSRIYNCDEGGMCQDVVAGIPRAVT